jgi:hypothetical protein
MKGLGLLTVLKAFKVPNHKYIQYMLTSTACSVSKLTYRMLNYTWHSPLVVIYFCLYKNMGDFSQCFYVTRQAMHVWTLYWGAFAKPLYWKSDKYCIFRCVRAYERARVQPYLSSTQRARAILHYNLWTMTPPCFCTLSHDFRGGGGGVTDHKICFEFLYKCYLKNFSL